MSQTLSALPDASDPTASASLRCPAKTLPDRWRRRIRSTLGGILCWAFFPVLAPAATLTWTNELGGNWSVPENWSPNQVPGNGDEVVINRAGTYTITVTAPLTVGDLELGSAAGPGTQTLSLNGFPVRLQSASVILPTGKLLIDVGDGVMDLSAGSSLVNQGNVVWVKGSIALDTGAVIQNLGLWDVEADQAVGISGVTSLFRNIGTFRKSGGTGATSIESGLRFENVGTVDVRSGSLNIHGDGQTSSPGTFGTFDVAAGSSLIFGNSYTLDSGTVLKGDGDVAATAGTLTLNGEITFTRLTLAEASLAGNHVLKGNFFWSAGAGRGGTTTIAEGSTLQFTNPSYDYDLASFGRSLINQGVVLFGGRNLYLGNGSSISNSGRWDTTTDNALAIGGGLASTFQNSGIFRKSGGSGISTVSSGLRFNNVGSVEIQSGTLNISGDGQTSSPGTFDIAAGASLVFGNSYTLASGTVLKGDGDVVASAGFLTMDGDISFTRLTLAEASLAGNHVLRGNFFWSGGAGRAGTTTVAEGSTLQFTNRVYDYDLGSYGRSLVNQGTIHFAGRSLYLGNGSSIQNHGLWETTTDSLIDFGGGAASSFQNIGTFRKAAGTGTSTLGSGLIFNNAGTLEVLTGTVRVAGSRSLQGTLQVGLTSLSDFGRLSFPGTGTFSGRFIATKLEGYYPKAGDVFDVVTYDAASGAFSQVDLPFAAAWETSFNANAFQLRVLNSRPIPPVTGDSTFNELTLLTVTNSARDLDLPANLLSYALLQAPAGMSVLPDGLVSWTPAEADGPGTNLVTVVVTDNGVPPLSATNSFRVAVREVNSPPILALPATPTLPELVSWISEAQASDADLPTNALTVTLVSGPPGLTVSPAGEIQWTPTETDGPGVHSLTLRVTDQNPAAVNETELSTTNTFTLSVLESNRPPVLVLPALTRIQELESGTLAATGTDPDEPANALAFALVSGPPGLLVAEDGTISWTPTEAQGPSTNEVVIRLSDSNSAAVNDTSLSVTNQFQIVVEEVNTPPVLALVEDRSARPGQVIRFTVSATDADLPANPLTFSLGAGSPGGSLDAATGEFRWRPGADEANTTNQFQLQVSDGSLADSTDSQSFLIVVDPLAPLTVNLVSQNVTISLLKVTGPADMDYFLEASTDLGTWTNLATRLSAPATFEFFDPEATDPSRFYRVRLEP